MYPLIMVIFLPCQNSKQPVLLTLFPKSCNMVGDSSDNDHFLPFFPRYCFSSVCLPIKLYGCYKLLPLKFSFMLGILLIVCTMHISWAKQSTLWLWPNRGSVSQIHLLTCFYLHLLKVTVTQALTTKCKNGTL